MSLHLSCPKCGKYLGGISLIDETADDAHETRKSFFEGIAESICEKEVCGFEF